MRSVTSNELNGARTWRLHVPEPPGHDPDQPEIPPPTPPDEDVELPPREDPEPMQDPRPSPSG